MMKSISKRRERIEQKRRGLPPPGPPADPKSREKTKKVTKSKKGQKGLPDIRNRKKKGIFPKTIEPGKEELSFQTDARS